MEAQDKIIKELFIGWAKQSDVKDPEQILAQIQALQLNETDHAYVIKQFEEIIQKAEQAGISDKWPDRHPAVPDIEEREDFHLYLNITKSIYSSELQKLKSLVSNSPLDLTTFGNQLKHQFSHIPRAARDVLLIPPKYAMQLAKMAQVRRSLNNFSDESIPPPWMLKYRHYSSTVQTTMQSDQKVNLILIEQRLNNK
jgi:hypothetical protein